MATEHHTNGITTNDDDTSSQALTPYQGKPPTHKVKSPMALAHVVLRTFNYEAMVQFWQAFLGAEISFQDEQLAFLRYDAEHHRIAIIRVPGPGRLQQQQARTPAAASGLEHVAFTYATLDDLVEAYAQRKALMGVTPWWCTNHGPTTSMYYRDPDGNRIETQVDNFDSVDAANAFMASAFYRENPIGTDFEPEDLIRRLESGEDHNSIKTRIEIGPRSLPEDF